MAVIKTAHHPELTPERVIRVFDGHFAGKYEVYKTRRSGKSRRWDATIRFSGAYKTRFAGRDFVVKKSDWTGVGVKLKQDSEGTSFVFSGLMPNIILNMLVGGLIAVLFLRPRWKALEEEVRVFIENAAEFR